MAGSGTAHLHLEIRTGDIRRCPQPLIQSLHRDGVGLDPLTAHELEGGAMRRLFHQVGKVGTFGRIGGESGNAACGEQEDAQETGVHRSLRRGGGCGEPHPAVSEEVISEKRG